MVRYFTDLKYLSLKYKNQSWQTMATYLHPHNVPILNYSSGPLPGFKKKHLASIGVPTILYNLAKSLLVSL